jgi:hypothetical protein
MMDTVAKLSIGDLQELVICSERYAIGRMSTLPSSICEMIKDFIIQGYLSDNTIRVLIKDIDREIKANRAGMPCDVEEWDSLLAILMIEEEYNKRQEANHDQETL